MATARVRWLFVLCLIGLAVYSSNLSLLQRASRDGTPNGSSKRGSGGREVPMEGVRQTVFSTDGYEKHLVIPSMAGEDISWVRRLPEDLNIVLKNYVMDAKGEKLRPGALTVPINKGREAMAYLTYIIDHYNILPDMVIFTHAHEQAWHNNDLQRSSTLVMLLELNYQRVAKQGYMNLRCHWKPGCPGWIQINDSEETDEYQERYVMRESLMSLFSQEMMLAGGGVPNVIGTPCCAQFAVTKERILEHPRTRYVAWRNWVIDTHLPDDISGRVMEYLWHYIFASPSLASTQEKMVACPLEHKCFCDGYGYCFGGADKYETWRNKVEKSQELAERLKLAEAGVGRKPGEDENWRRQGMERLGREIRQMREETMAEAQEAKNRGVDPSARRREVGDDFSG